MNDYYLSLSDVRQIHWLHHQGYTHREICDAVGCSQRSMLDVLNNQWSGGKELSFYSR